MSETADRHPALVGWSGRDARLDALGVDHRFALRVDPPGLRRPVQVHGTDVVRAEAASPILLGEADAVICDEADVRVGVVTADCVPILMASEDGGAVAAIHAGWRGLASGVVEQGAQALSRLARGAPLVAAIGPHAGWCCYEVDAPVLDAMAQRFGGEAVSACTRPTPSRPGHARIDLGGLVAEDLRRAGVAPDAIGDDAAQCTIGYPDLFDSFRRDGDDAGRMRHVISACGGS